jgi:hypothetical protein
MRRVDERVLSMRIRVVCASGMTMGNVEAHEAGCLERYLRRIM